MVRMECKKTGCEAFHEAPDGYFMETLPVGWFTGEIRVYEGNGKATKIVVTLCPAHSKEFVSSLTLKSLQ